jgi:hypothetical protein
VSTTEQRVQARIAESGTPQGARFAERPAHESIVRATAADNPPPSPSRAAGWRIHMLYTIAVILLVALLLGFLGIYTIGSFVHVLLVVAIVLFLVGLVNGRRVVG